MLKKLQVTVGIFLALVGPLEARMIRGGSTPPSTFNGGATQVNTQFIPDRSAFPFVDMAKVGGDITDPSTGAPIAPNLRDANGYPTSGTWNKNVVYPNPLLKPGDYLLMWTGGGPNTVMKSPGGTPVSGSLTGANGTYRFTPASLTVDTVATAFLGVQTTGAGYSPVTSLSLVNVNDFAAWQLDANAFAPEYIAAFAGGKYGVVRYLNWMGSSFDGVNGSTWTDWASRKSQTYHSFDAYDYRANWWGGNPTNGGSGNDYTLTTPASPTYIFGNGAPVDKQILQVQFSQDATLIQTTSATISGNTINWSGHTFTGNEPVTIYKINNNLPTGLWSQNYYVVGSSVVAGVSFQISTTPGGAAIGSFGTGAAGTYGVVRLPTLNINGTGAVPIRNPVGDPLTGAAELPKTGGATPLYVTMVYDAELNCWMKNGGTSNQGSRGISNGIPPELLLKFAIKVRAHPWFMSSGYAMDPMTDFWPTYAAYVKANSPAWMIPRYEGPNEQWNFASGFFATRYGWNKSWHHWGIQFGTNDWQGKIVSTLGQAVNAVYGGQPDGTKYWLVNGMQGGSAYYYLGGNTVAQNNQRMSSSTYTGQAAPAQSGYSKAVGVAEAYRWTTHVAPANYYTPYGAYNTLSELQTAILYGATNVGNSAAQTANLNTYANTSVGATLSGSGLFTIASPGVVNWPSHPFVQDDQVVIYTQGTLPTGLSQRVGYWINVINANSFNLKPSPGGALINFTGTQSGQHSISAAPFRGFNISVNAAIAQAFATWGAGYINNAGNPVGLTFYEGNWSPDTGGLDATTTVSAISAPGPTTVVTVGANTTLSNIDGSTFSAAGVGAQVGGSVSFDSIGGMTQLNNTTFSPSFPAGSANISGANNLVLNQAVSFRQTSGGLFRIPNELVQGAPYYVVSTGNPFQISRTRGGTPITFAGPAMSFAIVAYPGWFVTNVNGQQLTLDVDSSTFGTYTSGGTLTYTNSAHQITRLRVDGRLAPDLEALVYGNTWPVPSLYASLAASGGLFPSKYLLNGTQDAWSALQPNIYQAYPTTGEWIANRNFSPGYNFLLKRDLDPASNDNDPMWLEKAA